MESMLDDDQDNALLRITMGSAFFKPKKYPQAVEQLAKAVELKPDFASAWLLYGQALVKSDQRNEAKRILQLGIETANSNQEFDTRDDMQKLLNRLQK